MCLYTSIIDTESNVKDFSQEKITEIESHFYINITDRSLTLKKSLYIFNQYLFRNINKDNTNS
jgi:hypothetical protein